MSEVHSPSQSWYGFAHLGLYAEHPIRLLCSLMFPGRDGSGSWSHRALDLNSIFLQVSE